MVYITLNCGLLRYDVIKINELYAPCQKMLQGKRMTEKHSFVYTYIIYRHDKTNFSLKYIELFPTHIHALTIINCPIE